MLATTRLADMRERSSADASSAELACDGHLQRAAGAARLVVSGSEHGTRIVDVFQQSPLRFLFPRFCGGPIEEVVLVNTSGGIAGGDRLELEVTALASASVTVTSQAAEKIYRALTDTAQVTTRLKVHAQARLAWLPQETITFDGARLQRSTEIQLSPGAELLALEWLVLGRAAHGEEMVGGRIRDAWRVTNDGRLIWADSFRAADEAFPRLRSRALLSDFRAIGTLLYYGPDVDAHLQFTREQAPALSCHCAATVVGGLLIVRFAARVSVGLKEGLRGLLNQFGAQRSGPLRTPKMWSA
jgi:urease accessory protein